MGCGSSRSAVAVIDNNNNAENQTSKQDLMKSESKQQLFQSSSATLSKTSLNKNNLKQETEKKSQGNAELFQAVSSSKSSLQKNQEIENTNNNKNKKDNIPSRSPSATSNKSRKSSLQLLANENKKPSTASSSKSGDSGVFDEIERQSSAKSLSNQSGAPKPPSGKKSSSARKKLLRIDDQALEDVNDDNEFNIVERPKTRLGNVAFDLFVDTPETGNMKKKPDLLPVLESKRKRSKKVKTKEEIDQKMREVEKRRKIQEMEKQMKAKQFQHLAVHTTVQPFKITSEDEEDTADFLENKELVES